MEEVVIIIAEALTKHQAADHIRHSAAQEIAGIKRFGWREKKKKGENAQSTFSVTVNKG